jgi:colanic acid biosynthesis glycosyl transferase WcaI
VTTVPQDLSTLSIALVSMNFAPEHAGIAPYATDIAKHLVDAGASVHVITGMPHYPSWRLQPEHRRRMRINETVDGVPVSRFRHYVPRKQSAVRRALYEVTFWFHGRLPSSVPVDVVVAVSPSMSSAAIAARISRRRKVPSVVFVQDLLGAAAAQSGITGGRLVATVTTWCEAHLLRSATRVAVIHESFRDRTLDAGVLPAHVQVVPNWTHITAPSRDRAEVRALMDWGADEQILLHAGNMGLKQGLDVLVEAARIAETSDPAMRFVLMGDGNQRDRLEQQIGASRNIAIIDPVEEDIFADVLAAADLLVLTQRASVHDMSVPSKLTSYFAAGRPVLASIVDQGGAAEEMHRSEAGVIAAAEDPGALVRAAAEILSDPQRCLELGRNGTTYAAEMLSSSRSLATLDQLILDALRERPQTPRPGSRSTPAS